MANENLIKYKALKSIKKRTEEETQNRILTRYFKAITQTQKKIVLFTERILKTLRIGEINSYINKKYL